MDDDLEDFDSLRDFEQEYLEEKCGNDFLVELARTVIFADLQECIRMTREGLDERGIPPLTVLDYGLIAGMDIVGQRFRKDEIFVPEVLVSVRAMKGGVALIYPLLAKTGRKPVATVVLGTVQGDLHDIGKNLVAMMLEGANFKVIDLGIDQKPESFLNAIREHQPAIIGMSAMLTTTMINMKVTIDAIRDAGLREQVKIMIGGAPISQEFADRIGADAYGKDSATAVEKAKELLEGVVTV